MAQVPNRDQFYSSKRTGKTAQKTGGEIVVITFQIPSSQVVEVVKDTNPLQWRIHTELEHGFPDVTPNKQLGKLLAQVVDAIAEEDAHAAPTILPGTEIKPEPETIREIKYRGSLHYVYNSETFIEFAQSHGYTGPIDTDDDEVDGYLETLGITCDNVRVDGRWTWLYTQKALVKPTIKPVVPIEAACKGGYPEMASFKKALKPITKPITKLDIERMERMTDQVDPEIEAAPPVSASEFDPCPELADAERPSGVLTHRQELEEAHQQRAGLLKTIQSLTNERDAAHAETARTVKRAAEGINQAHDRIGKLNIQVEHQKARIENMTNSDEAAARAQKEKNTATQDREVAELLVVALTEALCGKKMDVNKRGRVWMEFYRRITVETEDYPSRLTDPVRDIAHKLYRGAIRPR